MWPFLGTQHHYLQVHSFVQMQISLCRPWATELEEGEGDHRHERMAVKSLPGSPFEVVEPKLLFQLLMGLLANPTCLDGGSQSAQIGRSRQIREICLTMQKVAIYGAFLQAACGLPALLPTQNWLCRNPRVRGFDLVGSLRMRVRAEAIDWRLTMGGRMRACGCEPGRPVRPKPTGKGVRRRSNMAGPGRMSARCRSRGSRASRAPVHVRRIRSGGSPIGDFEFCRLAQSSASRSAT